MTTQAPLLSDRCTRCERRQIKYWIWIMLMDGPRSVDQLPVFSVPLPVGLCTECSIAADLYALPGMKETAKHIAKKVGWVWPQSSWRQFVLMKLVKIEHPWLGDMTPLGFITAVAYENPGNGQMQCLVQLNNLAWIKRSGLSSCKM